MVVVCWYISCGGFCVPSSHPRSLLFLYLLFLLSLPLILFIHLSRRKNKRPRLARSFSFSPSRNERHSALLLRHPLFSGHDVARLQLVLGRPFEARHDGASPDGGGRGVGYRPHDEGVFDEPALGLRGGLDDEFVDQDNDDDDYYDEDWRVFVLVLYCIQNRKGVE